MKKLGAVGLVVVVFGLLLVMPLWAQDDVKKQGSCKYCGMDREKFAHTRMVIAYDDGTVVGTCSLHCTAIDLALHIDKTPKSLAVGDFKTKNLIDAEKAFWVIGGNKPGVMTKRAKWAFAAQEDAAAYIKENGGAPANFDQALQAAYEDIGADTRMIREKRRMKRQKMMEKK